MIMNIYAVIILSTLIIGFLLDVAADYYNIKNLKPELPEAFTGVYDEETYKKSQNYLLTQTKFGYITSTYGLAVLLLFWFTGGFFRLNIIVEGWLVNDIFRGIIYIGILITANSILSMPFSIYSTFVIEEKYGFNKTTPKTFILDILKSVALGIVIGVPVLAGVIYILENAGAYAWLYGWFGVSLIGLIIQFIAPRWLMPLFNKFTPLEDGELRNAILDYAGSVKFRVKNIFMMDGSKRSTKSNAFFTGFGKNKRIALFDTLIKKHTTGELVAVLAHEIGHYKKKHVLQGMLIGFLHTGLLFYLLSLFISRQGLFEAFYLKDMPVYAGLIFFGMLYSPLELILSIVMNIFSRKNEYEADKFSAETTGKPNYLVDALKKLSKDNLSNLTPHPFYVFLNFSHPPVLERINALNRLS
jgi:STE24 endopeptidase